MILYRYFFILIILISNTFANKIEIELKSLEIQNANVALITAKSSKHNNLKVILEDKEIPFVKHPFKLENYYVLVPFNYYMKQKEYQIIVTYTLNDNKYFEGFTVNLKVGNYQSEQIKVLNSKVKLSQTHQKRVSQEYKEAMSIYTATSKESYWFEDFIYPLQSKITSDFGTKRVYNNSIKSYHSGIDFKASMNTKVKAANTGIVRLSKNRFYAGNSIVIDHGQGIYSCYYHLNKTFVNVGDFVQKEDIIGLSGNTGRTTGPHLHFATFVNGIQISPVKLFETLNSLNN